MAEIIILGSSSATPFPRIEKGRWRDYLDIENYQKKFKLHDDPHCNAAKKIGKDRRTRSAIVLRTKSGDILFDAGPDIFSQIKKNKIKPKIAFISHAHLDASYNAKNLKQLGVKIYSEQEKNLKPGRAIEFFDTKILPFRVKHEKNTKTLGFQIFVNKKIISIATDFGSLAHLKKYFQKSDVVFVDGSLIGKSFSGHLKIEKQLATYKKWKIKKVIITHVGHNTGTHKNLCKFAKRIYRRTEAAYDGMKIKI